MSSSNLNNDLYKLKFPDSVKKGLLKLEEMNKTVSTPHTHKVQQHIIDEYIFNVKDYGVQLTFGPIDELIIVRAIAQHLVNIIDPAVRNSLFISLFPTVNFEVKCGLKTRILSSLVSLAVATHNTAVLDATSVWMQQSNCLNPKCIEVCRNLLQDYFLKKDQSKLHFTKGLNALPTATPLFTSNLLTSISQIYAKVGTTEFCDQPPMHLVEMVVQWLQSSPQLILAPITSPLPGMSLAMFTILPISPLAKWCIEAPLFLADNQDGTVYSHLHLLLLQTIQFFPKIRSETSQKEVIPTEHIKNIADVISLRLTESVPEANSRLALDRLAEITLIALNIDCLYGRTTDMWTSLSKIPRSTRLMKILLKHKSHIV